MIVFLALGANRRRAVIDDVSRALEQALEAVVVVDTLGPWRDALPDEARIVELSRVEILHRPRRWLDTALLGVPVKGMQRLGRTGKRAAAAYDRRVRRRLLQPLYERLWPDKTAELLLERVLGGTPQTVIATDPVSVAFAAAMIRTIRSSASMPRVAFGLDYADMARIAADG